MTRGTFIVFEGGEACGKTTQAARLAARLGALSTREPGGTEAGAAIRAVVLERGRGALGERSEAMLMAADRAQHVEELIEPTLAAGRHVVCDRYVGSSLAYQGYGRGLDLAELRRLSAWATRGLVPDLVILLDLGVSEARTRRSGATDRLEDESDDFHERVRAGFLELAASTDTWVVIDASLDADTIEGQVATLVADRVGVAT